MLKWLGSFKRQLIFVIIVCWLFPFVIIAVYSMFSYQKGILNVAYNNLAQQMEYSSELTLERINNVVKRSKLITYDGIVDNQYKQYFLWNGISWNSMYTAASNYINDNYSMKEDIEFSCILIKNKISEPVYSVSDYRREQGECIESIKDSVLELSEKIDTGVSFVSYDGEIFLVRNLITDGGIGNYGILILKLNKDYLFAQMLNNIFWHDNVSYMLNDVYGFFENGEDDLNEQSGASGEMYIDEALLGTSDSRDIKIEGSRYTGYGLKNGDGFVFKYKVISDNIDYPEEFVLLRNGLIIISISFLILLGIGVIILYRSFTKPLNYFVDSCKEIEKGNYSARIIKKHLPDEFVILTNSFNKMTYEIEYLINHRHKEELSFKDAKIATLQSQINPKFLYNALAFISKQAESSGAVKFSEITSALSTIINAIITRSEKRFLTLAEELNYSNAYLTVVRIIFNQNIKFIKKIDNSLLNVKIPQLIIQPLIENAINYTIGPNHFDTVKIEVFKQGLKMIIQVSNEGDQIYYGSENKIGNLIGLEVNGTSTGYSIRNINEQLKLIYGESSGLYNIKNPDGKIISRIIIPINPIEE